MKFQFENLVDFIVMSGHGPYVWAAYLITIATIVYMLVAPLLRQRTFFRQQQKNQQKIQQKNAANSSASSVNSQ